MAHPAAYLMAGWLGGQAADLLVSSSGQRFQGEGERIEAFRASIESMSPACRVHVLDSGLGLHGPTEAAVSRLLENQPGLAAVYSVGGANGTILSAFERAGRACRVFIGHDLDDDNLTLLRAGRLSAVLHHDLQHDLHMACLLLMQVHGVLGGARVPHRSKVEVITPASHSSSYPPHKHDVEQPPLKTQLEETYYHRLNPPQGFAFQRVYTDDRSLDEACAVEDHDVVMVPHGYDLYYLNVMAGPNRFWVFKNDPAHEWMLKA